MRLQIKALKDLKSSLIAQAQDDKPHDACGIVGIYDHPKAALLSCLCLQALQHRGQESAGIAALDQGYVRLEKDMGLVKNVFDPARLQRLPGLIAIGHTRYSTSGDSSIANAQPLMVESRWGQIAIAHNGNITNAEEIRSQLRLDGVIFQTNSDTEIILHLIARSREAALPMAIVDSLSGLKGAFSLVILAEDRIYAIRDPHGFRPLSIGRITGEQDSEDGATVFASETAALDLIGAQWVRDVKPGEMVIAGAPGLRSVMYQPGLQTAGCIFELVYLARPDSVVFGRSVAEARDRMGRRLAIEAPVLADVVVPVPDSGVTAAIGYSAESGIPYRLGLIRSHYAGRTFIEPEQYARELAVKLKLNPVRSILAGKRVVLVDDSIVRGTTSRLIIQMVRDAGAREVHMRVASPPFVAPCPYGIDTPSSSELLAAGRSLGEISMMIGADSVAYLSSKGLLEACGDPQGAEFCTCCFGGDHPQEQACCSHLETVALEALR